MYNSLSLKQVSNMMIEKDKSVIKKKISFSEIMKRQDEDNWLLAKNIHPKQVLSYENYVVKSISNTHNCKVNFKCNCENTTKDMTVEFSLDYKPTEEDFKSEFKRITNTNRFKNYNNIIFKSIESCTAAIAPEERIFLYIGKVKFNYITKKGNENEDIRIFILNYKPTKEQLVAEFESWIKGFNEKYSYRELKIKNILNVTISSIADIKLLDEIKNMELKDKKRVLVNKTNESNVLISKLSVKYTTDKNKRKDGVFLLPIATIAIKNNISNKEIENLININRQRKVSNAQILDTKVLSVIKL